MALGEAEFKEGLITAIPHMRAFARTLCRGGDHANDIVQETLLKAWEKRADLNSMECLKPWLFKILRNNFLAGHYRSRREISDVDGEHAARLTVSANQPQKLDFEIVMQAVDKLPAAQREALVLTSVEGLAYHEVAEICGCSIGTVKSRVSRARAGLIQQFGAFSEFAGPSKSDWAA